MAASRTIFIAGAGIGGLTASLALAGQGFRVVILEKAERLEEAGAGLLEQSLEDLVHSLGLRNDIGASDDRARRVEWHDARDPDPAVGDYGIGVNYISICEAAVGDCAAEAPIVAQGIRAVMSGHGPEFQLEYPCHSPQEQRWFVVRVTRFAGEGPVRVVVAHENITARKRAEEELQWKTAFLVAQVNSSLDGILVVDGGGQVTFVTPSFSQEFFEENAAATFEGMIHPEDRERAQCLMMQLAQLKLAKAAGQQQGEGSSPLEGPESK